MALTAKAAAVKVIDKIERAVKPIKLAVFVTPERDSVEWSMFGTALCARRMEKRPGDLAGIYEFSATTSQVEADLKFMGMK